MNQAPPPAQAMTPDPSAVDAAVRFCDDALAEPTVELLRPVESNRKGGFLHWESKTVTIPIANPAGAKVLSLVIDIPEYDVWHGSIVTAEGACVARVDGRVHEGPVDAWPPVPIEWGGARFGEVHDTHRENGCCCPAFRPVDVLHSGRGVIPFARGPGDRICFDSVEAHPTKVMISKSGLACLPFGNCMSIWTVCFPQVNLFKDSAGEKVIGKRVSTRRGCLPTDLIPSVLHFEDMTSEQRRLALVLVMCTMAQFLCESPDGGGF